jgi:DNA repair exonuclease SbcCD ATPase subunit
MKILELSIRNLRKIEAVDITPKSNIIKIEGKNGNGKTTVLDSIFFALAGGKIPDGVIKDKESKSIITVKFDNYIVKKTITDINNYLSVETIEGLRPKNPQSFLNDLVGKIAFDPLEFIRMKNDDQLKVLKKAMGIEEKINQLKIDETQSMEERKFSGRELDRYKELCKIVVKEISEPTSISEIVKELDRLQEKRQDYIEEMNNIKIMKNRKIEIESKIKEYEKFLLDLQEENKKLLIKLNVFEEETLNEAMDKVDHDIINKKVILDQHEVVQTEYNKYKVYADNKKIFLEKEKSYNDLDKKVESIRQQIKDTLNNSRLPIPGLEMTDDQLLYENHTFENVCESSKLKISIYLSMAMNPKLKIILIRDGSLLDKDSLKEIETMADKEDYQIWIEKVSDEKNKDDDNAIYIEEGTITN